MKKLLLMSGRLEDAGGRVGGWLERVDGSVAGDLGRVLAKSDREGMDRGVCSTGLRADEGDILEGGHTIPGGCGEWARVG